MEPVIPPLPVLQRPVHIEPPAPQPGLILVIQPPVTQIGAPSFTSLILTVGPGGMAVVATPVRDIGIATVQQLTSLGFAVTEIYDPVGRLLWRASPVEKE